VSVATALLFDKVAKAGSLFVPENGKPRSGASTSRRSRPTIGEILALAPQMPPTILPALIERLKR
jgi:hypothetical protein